MKNTYLAVALIALAVGCKDDGDTGETSEPVTTGSVEANDFDRTGNAATYGAFGFATNGVGVVFLSPSPDATCETVTDYLKDGGSYNPIDVLRDGHCSVTFRFNYDSAAGIGGVVHTQDDIGTLVNINCAMGTGSWEIVGSGNDRGYQFVGDEAYWWQGNAKTFSITTEVGADDNTPDITMDLGPDFGGQFIYEDLTPDPATGSVSGTVTVETCQALTQTPPWN